VLSVSLFGVSIDANNDTSMSRRYVLTYLPRSQYLSNMQQKPTR